MAKSIFLYAVLFGAVVCLCSYFIGVDIGIRYEVLGTRTSGLRGVGYEVDVLSPTVTLSGTQWSRKISRGIGYEALANRTSGLWGAGYEVRGSGYGENFIRNKITEIYSAEIGVREATGKNDGKRVEEYLAVTHLNKGYAWCAAFVSWVFAEAGFPQPRTPWSPALFPKERIIWERGKPGVRSEVLAERLIRSSTHALKPNTSCLTPKPADVFGIYFVNLKRIAHAGFIDEWGDKYVITVEGNTNEVGSAEGDGVYRRRRPIGSIHSVANWIDRP